MTAIEFNHVGKQYRLGLVSTGTLSHDINRWWQTSILGKEDPYLKIGDVNDRSAKASSEYVWALRDIDFKVEQGDVVGIIGKNGAGKSTLLKLLSKVTTPTVGTIKARGRIASLLEVGTGFHGEMTGRENIYMNGAILGMTKQEINRKLDEIVDFSGCEKYIDTPVKRYSSGMTVRLGFAVAAFLDPEILVVDEVLAVGDAEFQKKAIGKMKDVSQTEGRTVLFVSHNMASIRSLCKRGVLLEYGHVKFLGTAAETVDLYMEETASIQSYTNPNPNTNLQMEILSAEVRPAEGEDFYVSKPVDFKMVVRINKPVYQLLLGFNLVSSSHTSIARVDFNDFNGLRTLPPDTYEFNFRIPAYSLSNGKYVIRMDLEERDVISFSHDLSLTFEMQREEKETINLYLERDSRFTSIVRQNWLVDYHSVK